MYSRSQEVGISPSPSPKPRKERTARLNRPRPIETFWNLLYALFKYLRPQRCDAGIEENADLSCSPECLCGFVKHRLRPACRSSPQSDG